MKIDINILILISTLFSVILFEIKGYIESKEINVESVSYVCINFS